MAMNDTDNTRQYTKYKRHVNDATERVNAADINQIQSSINTQEEGLNQAKDTAFQERIYTIFDNNLYVNAMFTEWFGNGKYIDMVQSNHIVLNPKTKSLSIEPHQTHGKFTSVRIHSVHGEKIECNDFFLITNQFVPVGASIKYYLKLNNGEQYQINENTLKTPLHLMHNLTYGFYLVAELQANALGELPILNDYAIFYWDAQVEANLGMFNPDLQRFP